MDTMDTNSLIIYTTKPVFMLIVMIGYYSMIYILTKYMKNKSPYQLKYPMLIYNNAQILLNIYMIGGLMPVISYPNIYGINIPYTSNIRYFVYLTNLINKSKQYYN